jgi:Zn-dependent protease
LYAVSLVFQINACLAIFNLLPIPPFDGFGILQYFLNEDLYHKIRRNQQVISIVILMLLFLTDIFSVVINVFLNGIIFLFDKLTFFM